MNRPDLDRRTTRLEEDLTALSDTVVEIKEIVDGHTTTLADHGRQLGEIRSTQLEQRDLLTEQGNRLTEQGNRLTEQGSLLTEQGNLLAEQGNLLAEHGTLLVEILRRLEPR